MARNATTTKAAKAADNHQADPPTAEIEKIRVGDLHIDSRVQREKIVEGKLNRFRQKYNPRALGTFEVSRRSNGKLCLLDGMHRRLVILEKEPQGNDFLVTCRVHVGLSLQEEAELFVDLNNQQAASALDLHKVRVVQKDPVALALNQAVETYGWKIGAGTGAISAIKVLETLYYAGEEAFEGGGYGPQLVEDTVGVVTNAWGLDNKAVSQQVLKSVGEFILDTECWIAEDGKPEHYFDYAHLADVMRREFEHGPSGWLTSQRAFAKGSGKPLRKVMRESLVDTYNRKQTKKSRKLPEHIRDPRRIRVRTAGVEPATSPA